MLDLLSGPEGAVAYGLPGFEVPAVQPTFGVPATSLGVDGGVIRFDHVGPTSSVDGPVCEQSLQRGIKLTTEDPGVGTSLPPKCAPVGFGSGGADDKLVVKGGDQGSDGGQPKLSTGHGGYLKTEVDA